MKLKIETYVFVLLSLIFFLGARICEKAYFSKKHDNLDGKKIQDVFYKKNAFSDKVISEISSIIIGFWKIDDFYNYSEKNVRLIEKEDLIYFVFDRDSLIYWSDNSLPFNYNTIIKARKSSCVFVGNGWYYLNYREIKNIRVYTLSLLKRSYSFENKFLQNKFHPDFNIHSETEITTNKSFYGIKIYDLKKNYICTLIPVVHSGGRPVYMHFSVLFYALFLLFFLLAIARVVIQYKWRWKNLSLFIFAFLLLLIRYLLLRSQYPVILSHTSLFNPAYFASSRFFPTLGDLFIHAILLFYIVYVFYKSFEFKFSGRVKTEIYCILSIIVILLYFNLVMYILELLVYDSSITFDFYKIFNISRFSLLGFLIITLLFFSLVLLADKLVLLLQQKYSSKDIIIRLLGVTSIFSLFFYLLYSNYTFYGILFFIIVILLILQIRKSKAQYTTTTIVLLSFFISLFTLVFISLHSSEKIKRESELIAANLSNERDYMGELVLEQIYNQLARDTFVSGFLNRPFEEIKRLNRYISNRYFSGYLKKYDFQISICDPYQNLLLENTNDLVPCHSFFYNMIDESGIRIANTDFYYLDNKNGRISYLGIIPYKINKSSTWLTMFISIDSKLFTEQLGYPELLLEDSYNASGYMKKYSYAKYNNNILISQSGDFQYSLEYKNEAGPISINEFQLIKKGKYNHLYYRPDNENMVVLSYSRVSFINTILSFTYIFVLYFVFVVIVIWLNRITLSFNIKNDFKTRIKYSIVLLLILSFCVMGVVTIFYTIKQHENKQYELISEKIQSVLVELEHRVGYERTLDPKWELYLTSFLIRLSNIFFTDINIYDLNGSLLATSRTEVFDKMLIGKQINSEAFYHVIYNKEARYIHKEHIGKLSYLSVYAPVINADNITVAYLNLPYFTRQDILKEEIYTNIVAIINIFTILIIISIVTAVFISNQITKPLTLIQERFKNIELSGTNELIDYKSDDEIGGLIKEYNRMVKELTESAEKLARTERETAWREMAKQVAHEIKNPLTPMKLSVQHLVRAWNDKTEKWDDYLKKVSKTLIEQIDHLTFIASEFSNFAKMPRPSIEEVNLIDKIQECIDLFSNYKNIEFHYNYDEKDRFFVLADKEQLVRLFSNLIKNGIQSVERNKAGIIEIEVIKENHYILITLKDNGQGVPDELKEKLFQPNFTTKSGGMGMGLSIVKNIVENINGKIWFETKINSGSTFFIRLPLMNKG